MKETTCAVCANALERNEDLLCGDCSRAFTLMLELMRGHPEVNAEDLARMKDVFEWRTNRLGIGKPQSKVTLEVHA
jgi:hypothetical protein